MNISASYTGERSRTAKECNQALKAVGRVWGGAMCVMGGSLMTWAWGASGALVFARDCA
jgi:hypothetical protein